MVSLLFRGSALLLLCNFFTGCLLTDYKITGVYHPGEAVPDPNKVKLSLAYYRTPLTPFEPAELNLNVKKGLGYMRILNQENLDETLEIYDFDLFSSATTIEEAGDRTIRTGIVYSLDDVGVWADYKEEVFPATVEMPNGIFYYIQHDIELVLHRDYQTLGRYYGHAWTLR